MVSSSITFAAFCSAIRGKRVLVLCSGPMHVGASSLSRALRKHASFRLTLPART